MQLPVLLTIVCHRALFRPRHENNLAKRAAPPGRPALITTMAMNFANRRLVRPQTAITEIPLMPAINFRFNPQRQPQLFHISFFFATLSPKRQQLNKRMIISKNHIGIFRF
ncbi:MAG: hypothetical protein D6706_02890 [Chloroflexi bacterium]|nr:MAG: hypothetical protein D6706_02890 [Chloroflexota bacterium]